MSSCSEMYSISVSNSSCTCLLHYFAKWNDKSAEIIEVMSERHGLSLDNGGVHLTKPEIEAAIMAILELISNSQKHSYRVAKLEAFLDHVIKPAPDDESFYIHIA